MSDDSPADTGMDVPADAPAPAPVIVLIEPQLGENIGAAARAMMNFGLGRMRLVRPRGPWPDYKAINTASGAEKVLEDATLHDTTADAIADLGYVLATTARVRDMIKPVVSPAEAAAEVRGRAVSGIASGILFGPERAGLDNDDVVLADGLLIVPTSPLHTSINLAQTVLLTAYEWFRAAAPDLPDRVTRKYSQPASKQEIQNFYDHLEAELDACGFLYPPEKRARMVRNIRNIFARAELTDQEVRTLRGIVNGLIRNHERD